MKNFYVYQLRVEGDPDPFYVGKGKGDRAWDHYTEAYDDTNHLKSARIKRAIEENRELLVEFIAKDMDEDSAFRMEVWAIKMFGRINLGEGPLTNLTNGGDGGNSLEDPLIRAKWEASMKRVNALPEVKLKRSESAKSLWEDPAYRDKSTQARRNMYKGGALIEKRRMQGWSKSPEKWLRAEEMRQIWLQLNRPAYSKLVDQLNELGWNVKNLQPIVKKFISGWDPSSDPVYQKWKYSHETLCDPSFQGELSSLT